MTKKDLLSFFFLYIIVAINYKYTFVLFYYPIYKLSHLAAIATLAGTRQLTTDIRGGSPSYGIHSPILFSGSCIGP